MRTYIIRRLLLVIPTLFFVSIIVFLSVRLIPGDVITMMSTQASGSGSAMGVGVLREVLERELGLDVPWCPICSLDGRGVSRGPWGIIQGAISRYDEILPRLPVTLELGFFAMLISVITALPVGIYSAIRQDTLGEYMGRGIAIVFISVPLFWTATMVMIYPALWWGWSPPVGTHPFRERPAGPSGDVYHSGHCDGVVPFGNHYSNDAHHDAGSPAARLYPDGLVKKRGQIFFRFIQGLNVG